MPIQFFALTIVVCVLVGMLGGEALIPILVLAGSMWMLLLVRGANPRPGEIERIIHERNNTRRSSKDE